MVYIGILKFYKTARDFVPFFKPISGRELKFLIMDDKHVICY